MTSHERDLPGTPFLSPASSVPDFESKQDQRGRLAAMPAVLVIWIVHIKPFSKWKHKKVTFLNILWKNASLNSHHQSHFILVWKQHETLTAVSCYGISIPFMFPLNTLLGICYGMRHSLACAIYCVREPMFEILYFIMLSSAELKQKYHFTALFLDHITYCPL